MTGDTVTLSAELQEGYKSLRLTSEPAGLKYTVNNNTVTFTMPFHDVKITLSGVRGYQANFMYNYVELGAYHSADVLEGSTIVKPADPSVEGLTFAGWYDNAACEGEPSDFSQKITDNVTLYADWRVNVTVDLGGAKGQAAANDYGLIFPGNKSEYTSYTYATHKLGETALEYILPNYDGYDFLGWYLTPDFSGEPVNPAEYVLTGGVTFYACWKRIAILTYELNYGEQDTPYHMAMEHVGMPLAYIPEAPQRENYKFLGWFRTQEVSVDSYIDIDSYLAEGSMTLYAGWKPVNFVITYELNGGENNPANPDFYNIESGEIVFGEPTREGYTFLGWTATGAEVSDGVARIPAGSTGAVALTATWEPTVYTIRCELGRGELVEPAPEEYTIESADIMLGNPVADGHTFLGWTGTGLTEPTLNVVIPAGSTGDRTYKANWTTEVSVNDIVQAALNAIPDTYAMSVNDFTGIQDIQTLAMNAVSADATCAAYLDMLSVTAEQTGETVEDGAGYSYTVKITVTFTGDDGTTIVRSKNIALQVEKNPVTITADVVYPIGGSYIAYGTSLKDVALTGTATFEGAAVKGSFAWADDTIVPLSTDNGREIYKVVFTPDDPASYCTTEMLIAVNTQIGVQIEIDVPETIEYTGRVLDVSECDFLATDIATGEVIDGAALSITGAVLEQSQVTPGNATVTLADFESCELLGVSDTNLYAIVGKEASASIAITRAATILTGEMEYAADYGDLLSSIALNLQATTSDGTVVAGKVAWEQPATLLDEVGEFTFKAVFTPDDLNCYVSSAIDVKVTVNGVAGKVTYIIDAPDAPADSEFTVAADNGPVATLTFVPVEGEENRWTLTIARAAFDGSERAIMLRKGGNEAIDSGLTLTGRESEDEVTLTLSYIPRKLTVTYAEGLDSWAILSHDLSDMDAIAPGDQVTLSANLLTGYNNLRLTSDPEGLSYTSDGNTVTFTMPSHDVAIVLRGVMNYQVNCHYNYNDLGIYCNVETAEDGSIAQPADPTVDGLTFAGWYDNAACEGTPFDFSQKLSANINLYADWRVNVTVDFGGQKCVAAYYAKETGGELVPDDGATDEG